MPQEDQRYETDNGRVLKYTQDIEVIKNRIKKKQVYYKKSWKTRISPENKNQWKKSNENSKTVKCNKII